MANEITFTVGLTVQKGTLQFQSMPQSFTATMAGKKGPTPGAFTVPAGGGVAADLSELTTPGAYTVQNLSTTDVVEYGIADTETGRFFPMRELLPGEIYNGRFSRNLLEEYVETGTGTGTTGSTNKLWFRSMGAALDVVLDAFEA